MSFSEYDVLFLKIGGRFDFWMSQLAVVGRYVDAHAGELTKVQVAAQGPVAFAAESRISTAASGRVMIWDPTRGGMRMPHLHYAGEIYLLNESQWADFSKGALSALGEKLGKAQKVSFENVMHMSEGMAGM